MVKQPALKMGVMLCGLMLVSTATAQSMRPRLDYASAAKMRDGCIAFAEKQGFKLAIAIFDDSGRLVSFAQMDGASTAVGELAQWKGRSAASYRFATSETAKWNGPTAPLISTFEGGIPFFAKDGTPLGGIGVSGAESNDDVLCGQAGIAAAGLRAKAD